MIKTIAAPLRTALIAVIVGFGSPYLLCQPVAPQPGAASVLGTWKGDSTCVGSNRPACKNEVVVYRFEAVAGKSDAVLLLADKIIEDKRVPMGKLECRSDDATAKLSCDFTIRQTHGLWQYTASGETMEGTLVLLPDRELVRRVKVKRVSDKDVPLAPAREMYEGA